jgi:hypothetical protein
MYERFTDRARRGIQLANQEAQRFNHEYIGTEHILLGLVKEGSGVAADVLKNLNVDLRKARIEVEKLLQSGPDNAPLGKLPQTPRAKKVIEYSMEEARSLGHNYVGTEHILLGLLRDNETVAAQVLLNLGLRLENVRAETLATLQRAEEQGNGAYSPQSRIQWATPPDPVSPERQPRSKWSSCLIAALTLLAVGVLLAFALRWESQRQADREIKERWERQVSELESGKTTCVIWPEPRFLEGFVRDQPEVAAKVTEIQMFIGKVSDERFGYVKQFPRLETIYFYEIWEGADSFLSRIAGMETITNLAFEKTALAEAGVRAVASFPNLKRLHIDYSWNETSLEPLRNHKSLETLVLEQVPITKERIAIITSLPKLRELEVGGDKTISEPDFLSLQEKLPNVKICRHQDHRHEGHRRAE